MAQLKTNSSAEMPSKVEKDPINWDKVTTVQDVLVKTLESIIISLQPDAPDFIDGDACIDFNDMFWSAKYALKGIEGSDPYAVMHKILKSLADKGIYLEWFERRQHYQTVDGSFGISLFAETRDWAVHGWLVKGSTIDEFYDNYQLALEAYCKEIVWHHLEKERIASFV